MTRQDATRWLTGVVILACVSGTSSLADQPRRDREQQADPSQLIARVGGVNTVNGEVHFRLGRRDGLKMGTEVEIHRPGVGSLGMLGVTALEDDRAVAKVLGLRGRHPNPVSVLVRPTDFVLVPAPLAAVVAPTNEAALRARLEAIGIVDFLARDGQVHFRMNSPAVVSVHDHLRICDPADGSHLGMLVVTGVSGTRGIGRVAEGKARVGDLLVPEAASWLVRQKTLFQLRWYRLPRIQTSWTPRIDSFVRVWTVTWRWTWLRWAWTRLVIEQGVFLTDLPTMTPPPPTATATPTPPPSSRPMSKIDLLRQVMAEERSDPDMRKRIVLMGKALQEDLKEQADAAKQEFAERTSEQRKRVKFDVAARRRSQAAARIRMSAAWSAVNMAMNQYVTQVRTRFVYSSGGGGGFEGGGGGGGGSSSSSTTTTRTVVTYSVSSR